VGPERVRRSLQRQALSPVYERHYRVTSDFNHQQPVAPNVLERRFDGWNLNRAWVGDITYVSTGEGRSYLPMVVNLARRRIVGWTMRERLHVNLVCQALQAAHWCHKPGLTLITHSERGSQFASEHYRKLIADFRMLQSMFVASASVVDQPAQLLIAGTSRR
jgi:putative transposase